MFVGERDPLLDDTIRMAERWAAAGQVELHRIPEAPHGFIRFGTGMSDKALSATQVWVRRRMEAWHASE